MILALITTTHPIPERCNDILQDSHVRSNLPLFRMLNYLKQHPTPLTHTPHILEKFYSTYSNLLTKPNSIHQELYNYIATHPQHNADQITAKFPFLPPTLINNALKCNHPITRYIPPPPPPNHPPPETHNPTYISTSTSLISWNIAALNTSLPCIHKIIQKHNPAIITLQETKLTAKKPPKFLQKLFPNYILFFNNTHNISQPNTYHQYIPPRGGLLTLIHSKYTYPNNIHKLANPSETSPYLQQLKIHNYPLDPLIIINLYMPTHDDDIHLIPIIQNTIIQTLHKFPTTQIIMGGDFNHDIALIGHYFNDQYFLPSEEDELWRTYITTNSFTYIPTNTTYTRQGGHNYANTSLIDGFYYKGNLTNLNSHTLLNIHHNSDHFPLKLTLPPNLLLSRPPQQTNNHPPRLLNPIPQEKQDAFNQQFFTQHSLLIDELTITLQPNHLTLE